MFKLGKKSTKEAVKVTAAKKSRIDFKGLSYKALMKNRMFLGIFCLALALVIAFVAMPLAEGIAGRTINAVALNKDVKKGDIINAEDIKVIKVGGYNLPSEAKLKKPDIEGKYAAIDMLKGDIISSKKITDTPPSGSEYLFNLPKGKLAISIGVKSLAQGLSGKIRSGDIVRVYTIKDTGSAAEQIKALSPLELQYVEVLAVTNSNVDDITDSLSKDAESNEKSISTVTLAVNENQSSLLAGLNTTSEIHIALVLRGSTDEKARLLEKQDKLIN